MSNVQRIEETALAKSTEFSTELAPTSAAAVAQHEIQSSFIIARQFPRNEQLAFRRMAEACEFLSFAEKAYYRYKRGSKKDESGRWVDNYVIGPSVYLAREAARLFGNLRVGTEIVRDDEDARQIRAYALDLETNARFSADDEFRKLIQRKRDGVTQWVIPDERDLRELTNKHAAISERNCILKLVPKYVVDDLVEKAQDAVRAAVEKNIKGAVEKMQRTFGDIGVKVKDLESKLGHPLSAITADEVTELRGVYSAIRDGQTTWAEYASPDAKPEREQGSLTLDDLKPADEPNRGHGNEGMVQDAVEVAPDARESLLADVQALTEEHNCDGAVLKAYKVKKFSDLTDEQLRAIVAESRDWAK